MLLFSCILDIDDSMTQDAFIQLVIEWNQKSPHANTVIQDIVWKGERNIRYGSDGLWLNIEEYRNQNIIAVRYEKKGDDGFVWDTDYVMNFNSMKMAVRLDRSYTEDALDAAPQFATPYFITLLIERGYIKNDGNLPVLRDPIYVEETNLDLITNIINGVSHYRLPVVYITKTNNDEDPVNVKSLASRLKGVAHVLVQKSKKTNARIKEATSGKNEYYGSIGIYFPSKAAGYRRYLHRSTPGYDRFLSEKVFRAVIQFGNAQMVETLFTWQGVNNALLLDRLISNRQERLAAEKAQKAAEAEAAKLIDTLDEEERRIREEAIAAAKAEANELLGSFDEEMNKLQDQIKELTRVNEGLQAENQGLKTKIDSSDAVPVLFMGDEFEFYQGEIKDLLLAALTEALKTTVPKSRRAHIISDIIRNNDYQKLSLTKAEELKKLLNNYDRMSDKTKQELKNLGFEIKEEGKHYKITYYGDGRYQTSFSKTPSDRRTGKNIAQQTIKIVF